jgi:hypothetical protein
MSAESLSEIGNRVARLLAVAVVVLLLQALALGALRGIWKGPVLSPHEPIRVVTLFKVADPILRVAMTFACGFLVLASWLVWSSEVDPHPRHR